MPIYEFNCQECGETFEELVSLSADKAPPCPKCKNHKTKRLMSVTQISCGGKSAGLSGGCAPGGGFS